jgi:hypothetical protein
MKRNDFAEHENAVRYAVSSTLRSHVEGTLDDQQQYTAMALVQAIGEASFENPDENQRRLIVAARVAGNLAIQEHNKLTKGIIGRTAARVEIGLARIFDPYTRQALNSGIPQETALGVHTSSSIDRIA